MSPLQFRDNAPSQLRSSYGTRSPLFPRQHNSSKRKGGTERVTDRKARGLQTEEIGCKCQTFFSLLSSRRKQTSDIFSLLYTNLKGGFSSSVAPFSSCSQSFPAKESFPVNQLFVSGSQSIGVSASTSVLPMNICKSS